MGTLIAPHDFEGISADEYRQRIAAVRGSVIDAGLAGLIAFGDCWRGANITYFTEFRPLDGVSDIANAVFFLGIDDEPVLFVSEQCLSYAKSVTTFDVCDFREMGTRLRRFSARNLGRPVGIAGGDYVPASVLLRLKESFDPIEILPTSALAEIKAIKSDAEIRLLRRAASLTDAAMAAIRDAIATGDRYSERDLALIADRAMLSGGADRTAYDSMVQAGPRSAFNLARPTDRLLEPGDLVMTDIGARYRGYVADGGRGFTYGGVNRRSNLTPHRRPILTPLSGGVWR